VIERLPFLWPEIVLFVTTCVVMVLGLSHTLALRRATALVAGLGLAIAGVVAAMTTPHGSVAPSAGQVLLPNLALYGKVIVAVVGLLLLLLMGGTTDRREEELVASGKVPFSPLRTNRAEFYAFFLFSLTGLMLCAGADDLIWLFLALELTSLPTYIMVTISTSKNRSREAGVKYFFLGALGAAIFLYGFALMYGGTGTTNLNNIHASIAAHGLNDLTLLGVLLALIGIGFKIAAVPMHFYTADVYEGAAPQVSAFLAFVPKAAGFFSILLLVAAVGWRDITEVETGSVLPDAIRLTLWVIAGLTMTVGNVLAILQTSAKRMLAYSSIAHSGYMLVGVIAGPGDGTFAQNGIAAVLFYLLAYGVMNVGAFAVLAALEHSPGPDGEPREVESVDDLRGLCKSHPMLGWTMVICSLSLLGFPPLLGFFGKLPLFTSAIAADEIPLVIVLGVNSAIAAFYYLRLMAAPLLDVRPTGTPMPHVAPFAGRSVAAAVSAICVVALAIPLSRITKAAALAGQYDSSAAILAAPMHGDPEAEAKQTPHIQGVDRVH
jgi:NADH-quinone oxidoreductase subunit N